MRRTLSDSPTESPIIVLVFSAAGCPIMDEGESGKCSIGQCYITLSIYELVSTEKPEMLRLYTIVRHSAYHVMHGHR